MTVATGPDKTNKVFSRDGGICQICFQPVGTDDWDIDHIIPRSQGGASWLRNLRLTHKTCNNNRRNGMSAAENQAAIKRVFDSQQGNCAGCGKLMVYGHVNKVAVDLRLPVSMTNFCLMHRACRARVNSTSLQEVRDMLNRRKGECIKAILGVK